MWTNSDEKCVCEASNDSIQVKGYIAKFNRDHYTKVMDGAKARKAYYLIRFDIVVNGYVLKGYGDKNLQGKRDAFGSKQNALKAVTDTIKAMGNFDKFEVKSENLKLLS